MFVLELAFSDDPARLEGRPAHRERMAVLREQGKVLAAGPWTDESGAMLILLVPTRGEAEAIVADDPYYSGPGVQVVSLMEWHPVVRADVLNGL